MTEKQKRNIEYEKALIIQHLSNHKDQSVNLKDLSFRTGIHTRRIKKLIQQLRDAGYAICSTTYEGYWITKNPEDIERALKLLHSYRNSLDETITSMNKIKERLLGECNERE